MYIITSDQVISNYKNSFEDERYSTWDMIQIKENPGQKKVNWGRILTRKC